MGGGRKDFCYWKPLALGLGCYCNTIWQMLTDKACEPTEVSEKEQIPGHVGLLLDGSLLCSALADMMLNTWGRSQAWKAEPRESVRASKPHFLFLQGELGVLSLAADKFVTKRKTADLPVPLTLELIGEESCSPIMSHCLRLTSVPDFFRL